MVIWILGMSGSGKTTLAKLILKKVKHKKIIHIDGDAIRKIYNDKLGHSLADRETNAERISKLVKYITDQNIIVIASVLSNFPEWLKWNRKNLKNYYEIFLKTNIQILKKRKKLLYSNKIKNVIGLDLKFNNPKKPNLIIKDCNDLVQLKKIADRIANKIINKIKD